jgi:hypothetical protein
MTTQQLKEKKLSLKDRSKIKAIVHIFGFDAPAFTKNGLIENGIAYHYSKRDIIILINSIYYDIKGLI